MYKCRYVMSAYRNLNALLVVGIYPSKERYERTLKQESFHNDQLR